MKNFTDSDYALNKYSADIVYRFADGTTATVTLSDYLAENPEKTEADFLALKELSDSDYFQRDRAENAQTKKNAPFNESDETMRCCIPSPEDLFIGEINAREETKRREQQAVLANRALAKLTGIQRRRYLLYHVDGLTLRQIADMEGVAFQVIDRSISAAEKKIKKILADGKKTG